LKQHVFSFNAIEAVVIDEADRMFDLGFIKDIRFLLRRMPPREERQGMLFSATLSHRVLELAYDHMNSPEKVTAETETVTADRVRQLVYFPAKEEKLPLLINLLSHIDAQRSIVFVNTKIAAEKVTRTLERHGFTVATLSGDVPQAKRERLLAKFQKGEIELLVATDVAARGLHITAVSHVFNYDLPHDAEDYVHRIGRTARLGAEGDAISFACDLYAMGLPDIEAYIEQKIPTAPITAELLLAPPPRPRATPSAMSETDEEADDARNTAGPPPKQGASAPRPRGPRTERSGERSGERRSAGRRDSNGAAKPAAAAKPVAAPAPVEAASVEPDETSSAAAVASADAPRKRRRRGGRGRTRREGGEAMNPATTPAGENGTPVHNAERKPRREHAPRSERTIATAPPAQTETSAPLPPKQGFFRRIARLFTPR
ncbi:MAG: helicase-related protein, partial [Dokdonella sp.]